MEHITTLNDRKISYKWVEDINFDKLNNVTQVYGILFDDERKIVLIDTAGSWCLPGGTPKKGEAFEQTLIREVLEEADVEIENILPLGYQIAKFLEGGEEKKCQLRYIAKIKKILSQTPDPHNDKVPKRIFINPKEFLDYCPWGKSGEIMIKRAVKLFNQKLK